MSFSIKYNPLFSIVIKQSKRLNAISGSKPVIPQQIFQLYPTLECLRLLENYELTFRQRPYGIDVYFKSYPQQAADNQLINPIDKRIRLSFGIFGATDTVKEHFSKSVSASLMHLYFNNLEADGKILGNNSTLMSLQLDHKNNTTTYTATRVNFLSIRPPSFIFTTLKPDSGNYPYQEIVVKSVDNANMAAKSFDLDLEETPQIVNTLIDLSSCLNGRYTLKKTDNTLIQPIYVQEELAAQNPFGIMDIYWETKQASQNDDFRKYKVGYDEFF